MEKLYYKNNKIYNFEATIISAKEIDSGLFNIELDKTYFYPEGGGQPSDKGFIDGFEVIDVQKKGSTVLHTVKGKPLKDKVKCNLDKNNRLHFMVQHTGQHLISAILQKELNISTLSVHLGNDHTTIEIDRSEIDSNDLNIIEDKAYDLITNGNNIIYHETDDEGLKTFDIRRESKFNGYIRIVEIENYDCVPCGGVHLSTLSEIGLIKIIGYEKIRGNIRLNLLIGKNAYVDYRNKSSVIAHVNKTLSTKTEEIINRIQLLNKSISDLKLKQNNIYFSFSELLVQSIISEKSPVNIFNNLPQELLQIVSKELIGKIEVPTLLINTSENINWILVDSKTPSVNFNFFKTDLLPIISGKGGGKEKIWQGSGSSINLQRFLEEYKEWIS